MTRTATSSTTKSRVMSLGPKMKAERGMSEEVEKGETHAVIDDHVSKALTRKLLWKLDTRILPVLALLFLCSFLDRTNVGNAKLYHLREDIHMTDHQYDQGLAVFYATYIARYVPWDVV